MRWAHSLNYPHYNRMLADLTAKEWNELQVFFNLEERARDDARITGEEAGLRKMFSNIRAEEERMREP